MESANPPGSQAPASPYHALSGDTLLRELVHPGRSAIYGGSDISEGTVLQRILKASLGISGDRIEGRAKGSADRAMGRAGAMSWYERLMRDSAVDVFQRDHVRRLGQAISAVAPLYRIDDPRLSERRKHAAHAGGVRVHAASQCLAGRAPR